MATSSGRSFLEKLESSIQKNQSHLCVGLDPDANRLPASIPKNPEGVLRFLEEIVEATGDLACVFKPNLAFYGAMGSEGISILERVIRIAGERCPVIIDGKFGDIGNTASAYARMAFDCLGADAVTLNPYMGSDSLAPFLERGDKFGFVLGVTSNRSAAEIQKQVLADGSPCFGAVAKTLEERFPEPNWGWVAGATQVEEMRLLRKTCPRRWFLIPGVGAQGGGVAESMEGSRSPEGTPLAVINASRSILYASEGEDFKEAAKRAAQELVEQMRASAS